MESCGIIIESCDIIMESCDIIIESCDIIIHLYCTCVYRYNMYYVLSSMYNCRTDTYTGSTVRRIQCRRDTWEGVLYAEYSTRGRASRTIQHSGQGLENNTALGAGPREQYSTRRTFHAISNLHVCVGA